MENVEALMGALFNVAVVMILALYKLSAVCSQPRTLARVNPRLRKHQPQQHSQGN
jgi:hypothetical protein